LTLSLKEIYENKKKVVEILLLNVLSSRQMFGRNIFKQFIAVAVAVFGSRIGENNFVWEFFCKFSIASFFIDQKVFKKPRRSFPTTFYHTECEGKGGERLG